MGAAARFKNTYWLRCGLMPHLQRGLTPAPRTSRAKKPIKLLASSNFKPISVCCDRSYVSSRAQIHLERGFLQPKIKFSQSLGHDQKFKMTHNTSISTIAWHAELFQRTPHRARQSRWSNGSLGSISSVRRLPRNFRSACNTGNAPLRDIQALAGHSNLSTTQRYIEFARRGAAENCRADLKPRRPTYFELEMKG